MIAIVCTLSALAIMCAALMASGVALAVAPTRVQSGRAPRQASDPTTKARPLAAFASASRPDQCADVRKRLDVIDNKYLFRDTAVTCANPGHARLLYAATAEQVLCVDGELMGKVSYDERHQALFLTLARNAGLPDLGRGNGHIVTEISLAEQLAEGP